MWYSFATHTEAIMMNTVTTTLSSRVTTPKSDVLAIYISFIKGALYLQEANIQNKTIRIFGLQEDDASIPLDALAEARKLMGTAFCQVKVYQHPDYIEYYHRYNTKLKKHFFWVRNDKQLDVA
jgi:hypothetical protein